MRDAGRERARGQSYLLLSEQASREEHHYVHFSSSVLRPAALVHDFRRQK